MRETVNVLGVEIVPQHTPRPTRSIPCVEPACERCLTLRGGYKLRWYSRLWERSYRACRQPESWLAGEPENDDVNFPPELQRDRTPVLTEERQLAPSSSTASLETLTEGLQEKLPVEEAKRLLVPGLCG